MKYSKESLIELINSYKASQHSTRNSEEHLSKYLELAIQVQQEIEESSKDDKIKSQARKNLVINFVTALEVYFRDIIIEFAGKWDADGFTFLLKEKISLNEAFDLFSNAKVSKEMIIAKFSSFQNLESINFVYGNLLATKDFVGDLDRFAREIEKPLFEGGSLFSLKDIQEWRTLLSALLSSRHKFVHESNVDEILEPNKIYEYLGLIVCLLSSFERFIKHKLGIVGSES